MGEIINTSSVRSQDGFKPDDVVHSIQFEQSSRSRTGYDDVRLGNIGLMSWELDFMAEHDPIAERASSLRVELLQDTSVVHPPAHKPGFYL